MVSYLKKNFSNVIIYLQIFSLSILILTDNVKSEATETIIDPVFFEYENNDNNSINKTSEEISEVSWTLNNTDNFTGNDNGYQLNEQKGPVYDKNPLRDSIDIFDDKTDKTRPNNIPPIANFSTKGNDFFAYFAIEFNSSLSYDPDGFIVSYKWYFDDGFTSDEQNPKRSFGKQGEHRITLQVIDNNGSMSCVMKYIRIYRCSCPPDIFIKVEPNTGFAPLKVNFSIKWVDLEYSIKNEWDFGEGNKSNKLNTNHTYQNPGRFNITVDVWDEQRRSFTSRRYTVNVLNSQEAEEIPLCNDTLKPANNESIEIGENELEMEKLNNIGICLKIGSTISFMSTVLIILISGFQKYRTIKNKDHNQH